MLLWITFAVMTAAVLAALLWPVYRGTGLPDGVEAGLGDAELAVYRDQLAEIDRDVARGLIDPAEAEATRNEVSRRMLAAARPDDAGPVRSSPGARRAALATALVGIPVIALSAYLAFGRPDLPGLPQAERMATAVERSDHAAMLAQVEAHLAENPRDAQGWLVLAPAYRGMGRYGDAAEAFARALELVPAEPGLLTDFGEALVMAEEGLVTARARDAFQQALALEPGNAKALFYSALADRQDGRHEEALATWQGMLESAPADAPWRPAVERQLETLELEMSGAPQLSEADVASARDLEKADREAMIRGMVDGLAQRLEQDGDDLQGWLRLANARVVLGERDAAVAALRSAEQQFSGDADSLQRIAEARTALGLEQGSDKVDP
ncbi:MAG: c-type cytochrome biogenesis protein CcmI [Hyphomicrobiales bacterium]